MRRIPLGLLMLAACHAKPAAAPPISTDPVARTTTAGALDSLPVLSVSTGRLVCLSDGQKACPNGPSAANWLHDGKFAAWEPHHPVQIWSPNKPDPQLLGEIGNGEGQYDFVVAVAATPTGYILLNTAAMRAMRYDAKGKLESSIPFPPMSITHATGYSGDVPFYQVISETGPDSAALFEVRAVDGPGDTVGHVAFKTKLNWLHLRDSRPTGPLTLFPVLPSFTFAADTDLIWSAGDRFTIERRMPDGKLRWSLTSDATGPPTTAADIADARSRLPASADAAAKARFDSSAAHTEKVRAAVGAIYAASDGRVAVAGVVLRAGDSVRYVLLDRTGQPTGKFWLPQQTRLLLFAGDSILAQRAGANAQQELRWLMLGGAAKP